MKKITKAGLLALLLTTTVIKINAQVSGTVYRDINNSGTRTVAPATPFEPGVFGVTVRAYNANGVQVGSTTTAAAGTYSLPGVTTFPVRLEFITAENEFPGKKINANSSNIQFISATTSAADYAIGYNTMFSNNANPWTATTAAINGNSQGGGSSGTARSLYVQEYALDNTPVADGANYDNRWIGATFGLTFQRETRSLLMAAYLKRHIGFGPGGIDAIYKTVISTAGVATQPVILLELANLGINVGTDPRTGGANPIGADSSTRNQDLGVFGNIGKAGIGNIDLAENGRDLFVTNLFENKIHRINIGMPVKNTFSAADVTGNWTIPGPTGLPAGTEWHIMGVKYYQGKVYVGGVTSIQRSVAPIASAANLTADQVNLIGYVYELNPATGTITQVLSFPFNYRRGNANGDRRYEFKNNWWRAWQNNGDADVVRNDFNDATEIFPQPGAPFNTANNTGIYYPQPMIGDIEFDVDGSMIIGVKDRFGDQTGFNNYLEGVNGQSATSGGQFFRGLNSGEILRAGKGGSTWTLESAAQVTTNSVLTNTNAASIQGTPPAGATAIGGTWNPSAGTPYGWGTTVATEGFGPGGRYYYYNHATSVTNVPVANAQDGSVNAVTAHYLKSNGGIALFAGYDEMIHTAMDPDGIAYSNGLLRFSNKGEATGTNAGNMTDQMQIIPAYNVTIPSGIPYSGTMGKSNGLGDIEILSDAMPIEIGNRIWNDVNANGIQDANEAGINAVAVVLRSPGANGNYGDGDDQTWTVNTDANGNYYFDNTGAGGNVNDSRATALGFIGLPTGNTGILNSQDYRIEIDPSQAALTNFRIAVADVGGALGDNIDNDGSQAALTGVGTRAFANVNTSNNDYNFDFGFTQKATIGNRVWLDMGAGGGTANNGIQDGSEPGVAGVTVQLYQGAVLISTTVTDAYGNYLFENLTPGSNYTIRVLPPVNYIFSPQTNTTDNTVTTGGSTAANGSDVNAGGVSDAITLSAGENDQRVDAGLVFSQPTTGSIGDRVWRDTNGNGIQDTGEPGMAGVTVTLYDGSGNTVATTVTDANGNYLFSNLPAGNYSIGTSLPAGFRYTAQGGDNTAGGTGDSGTDSDGNPATGRTTTITLGAGQNFTNVDIGLVANAAATSNLGDRVWLDLEAAGNGIQNAGEPGVSGVIVTLYQSDGTTVVATTTTDAFGNYMFTNLPAAGYVVGIGIPAGFTLSPSDAGANNNLDNDIIAANGNKTGVIPLAASTTITNVDAGIYRTAPAGTARLGDRVWFDQDSDGTQDAGEAGAPGVAVELLNAGGTSIDPDGAGPLTKTITTTDIEGNYQFTGLAAGSYRVQFSNLPNGYVFTQTNTPGDNGDNTNSDANTATGISSVIVLTGGESEQTIDAGIKAGSSSGKASIGNKVWYDVTGGTANVQDINETGAVGVTVTLRNTGSDGVVGGGDDFTVATQTTNSLGEYLFTGLDAANYYIEFSNLPAGYNAVTANSGSDDERDSDGVAVGGGIFRTAVYSLPAGEDNLSVDMGIIKISGATGSISNRVWFDANNDGDRDNATEPGIAGVTVTLYDAAGVILAVTTTDANGYYLFDNLAAKTTVIDYYQIGFSNYPPGLVPTLQTVAITNDFSAGGADGKTQQVNLAAGQNRTDVDFGLRSTRSSLGNFVWIDTDGDGVQDVGEPGVAGVTVLLYFDANNDGDFADAGENVPAASMITDQNGQYLFTNLNAGNYQVEFTTIPNGLNFTQQNTPGDNGNNTNSDAASNGRTPTVTLSVGEADLTIDAGLFKPRATIGNYIWVDGNNNGIQDTGEPGIGGVLVTLIDIGTGLPAGVAITDGRGFYQFNNVPPGNYTLQFSNLPPAATFALQNQGGDDNTDSDVNPSTSQITGITVLPTTTNLSFDGGVISSVILPVRIELTAFKKGTTSELIWKVSGDLPDARSYVVERSTDGINYIVIGAQQADTRSNYQKIDLSPNTGINYYRIKVEYINGLIEYSETRIVIFNGKSIITIFPNPASDIVSIQLPESWQGKSIQIDIINQAGQLVLRTSKTQASQVESLQVSQLAVGMYHLRLQNNAGIIETRKLQIQ